MLKARHDGMRLTVQGMVGEDGTYPRLFAGYRLGDVPGAGLRSFPWKITGTEALLVNAYDFTRPKFRRLLDNGWSAQADLDFDDGPMLIDSGAYYFRKRREIDVSPSDILKMELASSADIGVVLDHPFTADAPDRARRIDTTLHNIELMMREHSAAGSDMELMPVVHGHTADEIRACLKRIHKLSNTYYGRGVTRVGIGSVAPLAKHGNSQLAASIIRMVRRELPDAHIHCFSLGSALLMLLAFYCGADSVDSQSWIVSAAFKLAQLPGRYTTRLASRFHGSLSALRVVQQDFSSRLLKLHDEAGYSVRDWVTGEALDIESPDVRRQYVERLTDFDGNEHVHRRACHNLWTLNFEVRQVRAARDAGRFEDFVSDRLRGTRYRKAFDLAREQRCGQ